MWCTVSKTPVGSTKHESQPSKIIYPKFHHLRIVLSIHRLVAKHQLPPNQTTTFTFLISPITTCQCPRRTSPALQMERQPLEQSSPLILSSILRNYSPSPQNNKTYTSLHSSQPSRNMSKDSRLMTAQRSSYT